MGKCKFKNEWLDRKDTSGCTISEWGQKKGESDLFCILCVKTISTAKGFYAIQQHYQTEKHMNNYKLKKSPTQLHLSVTKSSDLVNNQCQLYNIKDSAYKAELIWCMKIIASNMSVASCQNIANVFRAMFPEPGVVPQEFTLNPTKVRYLITDALAPYFRNMLLKEIQSTFYTLQYDETTNSAGAKELQIAIKFWSNTKNEIVCHHLETFFMGHATAEGIQRNIMIALENAGLSLSKLLMLGSDGPRVNQKVFRLVNEEVKLIRDKGLIEIGFCNIHLIHNAFQKGLEELGCDASDLILNIYRYFKDWPSRWEDYAGIQKNKCLPKLQFIKHVSCRWLTIEPAASRLLQQWDAVIEYFLKFIPSKQTKLMSTVSYKRIVLFLKKKTIKAELKFICVSSSLFTKFTALFQKEEPLIHILYQQVKELIITLMGRTCKKEAIDSFIEKSADNAFEAKNLLDVKDLPLSNELKILLAGFTNSEKVGFCINIRKHYVAAGNYILKKNIINIKLLKMLCCLKPTEINNAASLKKIITIASFLPIEHDSELLIDEWKMIHREKVKHNARVDHYWAEIFCLKSANGDPKYPNVTKIVKGALTLSHGSADVERGFSKSCRILTEDKTSMSIRTLNSKCTIHDGLKRFNGQPELVPITKELLSLAHVASSSYKEFLAAEKKKTEADIQKTKQEHEAKTLEEENFKRLEDKKANIEKLRNELKVAKGDEKVQTSISEELLDEANKKLKVALEKHDFTGAKVAQTLIEGVMKSNVECKLKRKAVSSLQENLEKQKDFVITNFFAKKRKE